jgi:hypothetical protein
MDLPIRILAVVPEPRDAPWAAAAAAIWTSIETALGPQVAGGALEIVRVKPATAQALEDLVRREPFTIVHIVSRGTSRPAARHGTLTLEGSDGRARDLNAQNVARICASLPDLEAVILQNPGGAASEFDVLRDTIVQQAASVVCAPAAPADARETTEFARVLYIGLASGTPLTEAVAAAARNPAALPGGAARAGAPRLLLRERPAGARPDAASARPRPVAGPPPAAPPQAAAHDAGAEMRQQIERKRAACAFDVFLCHNVGDKPAVMEIGRRLMTRGVLPWLDQWELRPGTPWQRVLEEQIANIRAAAVFVGPEGIGPWQRHELEGFLREFNERGCPVIPVMLPGAGGRPEIPLFLRGMTWVDFRVADPEPLTQLIWGITGQRPQQI